MGKQETEMLKGTLEGIVLAILSGRPAYGYEITSRLRQMGFEGAVREGADAQSVLPQRACSRIARRGLEDVALPRRSHRSAPPRERRQ